MSLILEKVAIKKGIDKVQDKNVLQAIKTILHYSNQSDDVWDDKDFVAELDRRSAERKSGKVKSYTWEETKAAARKSRTAK